MLMIFKNHHFQAQLGFKSTCERIPNFQILEIIFGYPVARATIYDIILPFAIYLSHSKMLENLMKTNLPHLITKASDPPGAFSSTQVEIYILVRRL